MQEFQMDYLGRDKNDMTAKLPPIRCSDDLRRDVSLLCQSLGLKYAVLIRLILGKLIVSQRTYPKTMRQEPMKEIEQAVDGVMEYIPVIRRQLRYNPKQYNYEQPV